MRILRAGSTSLLVQFAEQEDLDAGARLLLVAIEAGGEHLRVVEDEDVPVVKILQDVLEDAVLYFAGLAVEHHQARLVPVLRGVQGNLLFGKLELEL